MFATSPLVSGERIPFAVPRMLPSLLRRLVLLCCLPLAAHANSLVSFQTTALTPEAAAGATKAFPAKTFPVTGKTFPLGTSLQDLSLPGLDPALTPVVAAEQQDALFIIAREAAGGQVLLRYTPKTGWERRAAPPYPLLTAAQAISQAHLFFVSPDAAGGKLQLVAYHTITNTWAIMGTWASTDPVESVVPSSHGFVVTTRDASGVLHALQVSLVANKRSLGWIDWSIIIAYLIGTAGIGLYFYLQEKKQSKEDFFLGGRDIPWWAAGVSLYATGTSAISFIAIPAKSFATNWLYLAATVLGLFGTVFTAIWVVPLIRRLNLMSVYQYLEMRFHPKIRVLSSALSILFQLGGRMSIVLFLPSLAMSAVTGLGVIPSILIMGVVTILYTVLGGMKAVIWTDFIQVFVMLGGAFYAVGYIIAHVDGGAAGFMRIALADDKLRTFDWSFNLTQPTVWGFLLMVILGVLTAPQDQVMMQRVLSTRSDKEAGWSMWTLAAIVVPGSLTFFAIGTALYVFYKNHPANLNPLLPTDSVFPQFIAGELPVGITGLIIAGIFAASMSTLSSCINSVATLVSVDFYERYAKHPTPAKSLRLAEWMTLVAGLIGIGAAVLLALVDIKSALDKSFELTYLLGGGFAGCYALGLFTRRANWQGAAIGVASSIVLTFITWMLHLVHPYFYGVVAVTSCIVVGYAASLFFPAPTQSLLGLTIYTPRKTPLAVAAP